MTDTMPIIYLDVDGVLNSLDPATNQDFDDWELHKVSPKGREYDMHFSPTMIERLFGMDAEVRWLTTWLGHIDLLEGLAGIPSGLKETVRSYSGVDWWKADALIRDQQKEADLCGTARPFVWIDDDLQSEIDRWCYKTRSIVETNAWEEYSEEVQSDLGIGECLWYVSPNLLSGLTISMLDDIEKNINGYNERLKND